MLDGQGMRKKFFSPQSQDRFWVTHNGKSTRLIPGVLGKIKIDENKQALILSPESVRFLLGLLFIHENGDDVFLRNDGQSANYTAVQPRRLRVLCVPVVGVMVVILERCME
jgi:hypothetical protein